jgi:hypothetical protein
MRRAHPSWQYGIGEGGRNYEQCEPELARVAAASDMDQKEMSTLQFGQIQVG